MSMTSRLAGAALTVALAAALPASVNAQSLSGSWELETEGRRGPQTITMTLEHEGSSLGGMVTLRAPMGRRGGGGGGGGAPPTREVEITEGSVDGSAFSFTIVLEANGNSIEQTYEGTFDGNTMSGEVSGMRGARPFTGKRVE